MPEAVASSPERTTVRLIDCPGATTRLEVSAAPLDFRRMTAPKGFGGLLVPGLVTWTSMTVEPLPVGREMGMIGFWKGVCWGSPGVCGAVGPEGWVTTISTSVVESGSSGEVNVPPSPTRNFSPHSVRTVPAARGVPLASRRIPVMTFPAGSSTIVVEAEVASGVFCATTGSDRSLKVFPSRLNLATTRYCPGGRLSKR